MVAKRFAILTLVIAGERSLEALALCTKKTGKRREGHDAGQQRGNSTRTLKAIWMVHCQELWLNTDVSVKGKRRRSSSLSLDLGQKPPYVTPTRHSMGEIPVSAMQAKRRRLPELQKTWQTVLEFLAAHAR